MSYEDPDMLDYVDEDYDWNRGIAEPEDSGDVDAEFLALLEDEQIEEQAPYEDEEGEDDLLADLDAALDEIEAEIRTEAREAARPSEDVVELLPTWDRVYKVGSQNFICSDRITAAPRLKSKAGCRVTSPRSDLNDLLGLNLNRARMAREQKKAR